MEFLKNKREQAIFLVASLALVAVGFFMNTFAIHRHDVAIPLITIATSIAILSVIHLFLPDKFFKAFRALTFLYLGVFIIFFIRLSGGSGGSAGPDIIPYDKEIISTALSNIYYALSLSIILYYIIANELGRLWKKKPWKIFSISITLVILVWILISAVMYATRLWEYFEHELFYVLLTLMVVFYYPYTFLVQLF